LKGVFEMEYDLTYLSLGAGRQSSAVAICSALGLHGVPKADLAIFADTQDENQETYDHLNTLEEFLKEHGIPLHKVTVGKLSDVIFGKIPPPQKGFPVSIPAWTAGGLVRRQCTAHFKLDPIQAEARRLLGYLKGERIAGKKMARAMIGISMEEISRMKPSRTPWICNHYPLIDARLRVEDCMKICKEHLGYIPGKSACVYCPYHDDRFFLDMKTDHPEEFEIACQVDEEIRNKTKEGKDHPVFVHKSLTPLRDVDFETLVNDPNQLNLWNNACEGHCGV